MISFKARKTMSYQNIMCYITYLIVLYITVGTSNAQTFSSESTGADGPFNLTAISDGSIYIFDPANFAPRPVGDHVYNFTTINIEAGVTVRMSANELNGPVTWLATGDVIINGDIDLSAENGLNGENTPVTGVLKHPLGGAGGFPGGLGQVLNVYEEQVGYGPGAGNTTSGGGTHVYGQ